MNLSASLSNRNDSDSLPSHSTISLVSLGDVCSRTSLSAWVIFSQCPRISLSNEHIIERQAFTVIANDFDYSLSNFYKNAQFPNENRQQRVVNYLVNKKFNCEKITCLCPTVPITIRYSNSRLYSSFIFCKVGYV